MKDIFRLSFLSSKNQRDRLPSLSMTVPCWPRSGCRWRLQLTSATSRASAVLKGTRDIVWFNPFGSQLPKCTSFVEATSAPLICGQGLRRYFREIKPPRSGKSELLCAVGNSVLGTQPNANTVISQVNPLRSLPVQGTLAKKPRNFIH